MQGFVLTAHFAGDPSNIKGHLISGRREGGMDKSGTSFATYLTGRLNPAIQTQIYEYVFDQDVALATYFLSPPPIRPTEEDCILSFLWTLSGSLLTKSNDFLDQIDYFRCFTGYDICVTRSEKVSKQQQANAVLNPKKVGQAPDILTIVVWHKDPNWPETQDNKIPDDQSCSIPSLSPSGLDILCPCKTHGHWHIGEVHQEYKVWWGSERAYILRVFKVPGSYDCPMPIYPS